MTKTTDTHGNHPVHLEESTLDQIAGGPTSVENVALIGLLKPGANKFSAPLAGKVGL